MYEARTLWLEALNSTTDEIRVHRNIGYYYYYYCSSRHTAFHRCLAHAVLFEFFRNLPNGDKGLTGSRNVCM